MARPKCLQGKCLLRAVPWHNVRRDAAQASVAFRLAWQTATARNILARCPALVDERTVRTRGDQARGQHGTGAGGRCGSIAGRRPHPALPALAPAFGVGASQAVRSVPGSSAVPLSLPIAKRNAWPLRPLPFVHGRCQFRKASAARARGIDSGQRGNRLRTTTRHALRSLDRRHRKADQWGGVLFSFPGPSDGRLDSQRPRTRERGLVVVSRLGGLRSCSS